MTRRVPVIQGYTHAEVKGFIRRERARLLLNAFFALLTLLFSGWLYAQIVRLMGAPSPVIGATAVGVQFITAICAMAAQLGEHFVSLCKGIARMVGFVAKCLKLLRIYLAVIAIGVVATVVAWYFGWLPVY